MDDRVVDPLENRWLSWNSRGACDPRVHLKFLRNVSDFYAKLANPPRKKVSESMCCWTDLLGFGTPFYESRWAPSQSVWDSIFERISEAHACCYQEICIHSEFLLALNDGIVRCFDCDHDGPILNILSRWLSRCMVSHNWINDREEFKGLPGARTVVAFGPKLVHGTPEVREGDFIGNYTKPEDGPATYPGAETLTIVNPLPLQLNLAFSKAYILDRYGSKFGISGPHFYVDQNVVDFAVREFRESNQNSAEHSR